MRNKLLAALALAAWSAVPAAAAPAPALLLDSNAPALAAATAAQEGGVRVWMDGYRDVYRSGERMNVRVRTDYDAYVAVFHIDTNGDVDILYPRGEHDDGWLPRGRTLHVGTRGWDYLRARGGYGMGYVFAVALDEPLEMWRVRDLYRPRLAGWDSNRTVWGDPFYAIDEIVRAVVPEPSFGYESVDYATYHVGRRYTHPRYACYDGFGDWYHDSYYNHYGSCDRVRVVLVHRPYYYDTYRWRGSRRVYYDDYYVRTARSRPMHGYKERTDGQAPAPPARASAQRRPAPSGGGAPDTRGGNGDVYRAERPEGGRSGGARPETRRDGGPAAGPSEGRRPDVTPRDAPVSRPERGGTQAEPRARDGGSRPDAGAQPRVRDRGGRPDGAEPAYQQPRERARTAPPQQDTPVRPERDRPTFQRRPPSDEPRRESPPRQAEPRRESPPARQAEPRRESPPARQAEPRRESPPARQAEPRREAPPARDNGGAASRVRGASDN